MSQLSDDEIEALRKLIPIADEVRAQSEYRAAQRLVFRTWRQGIITLAGLIAAVYLLRDHIARLLGGAS